MRNRRSKKGSSSAYLGVCWDSYAKKWKAQIGTKHIGHFDCEIEAAKAFDKHARQKYGAFANPNFQ
jgi:hypothetical protein